MEAFVITTTLLGSFVGAFALQKAALEGLFRMMHTERTFAEADARRAPR
jgi:hypothetical protein